MATQFNVTELDFDKIKENLISHFRSLPDSKYKDYDFEGSGLNTLMDILAYNTHYNAIHAHTAINESFLDSAQLRQNVVSRAKLLSYIPKSILSPCCILDIVIPGSANDNAGAFTLPALSKVSSKIDGKTYSFITLDDHEAVLSNNDEYVFDNVKFFEGVLKSQRFIVRDFINSNQQYILKDNTADISTMKVKVFDNDNTNNFNVYSRFTSFNSIDFESNIYFISETADGNHQIEFGNNVYGKEPLGQNIIELEYISTSGAAANNATQFKWASSGITPKSVTINTKSTGGAERENIESVRFNAPLTFISQERGVTVDDYMALINRDYEPANIISVWGGEDNVPPRYGEVFVAVKPHNAETLTSAQKVNLNDLLKSKNVASTSTTIVDPEYTYIYFEIIFKYNSNRTTLNSSELQTRVKDTLRTFNVEELEKFNVVFRHSNLLTSIDRTDTSIISSLARVAVYKNLNLADISNISSSFNFNFQLDGSVDQNESMLSSDSFRQNNFNVRIGDQSLNATQRRIYTYRLDADRNEVKVDSDVGTLTPSTGEINFSAIFSDSQPTIKLYALPSSNDIVAKRNTLLQIDSDKSVVRADKDTVSISGAAGATDYITYNRQD
tara:strand:+ start:181 stop:2022 length:1842 start_codon:yes stop_codon:yes gene_type:complete